jgi:hypothetical protein
MTEGAHRIPANEHPSVHGGEPASNDIRLIDEAGQEMPKGETEAVGHSPGMMRSGYLRASQRKPAPNADAEGNASSTVTSASRPTDSVLMDRRKDMISGGVLNAPHDPKVPALVVADAGGRYAQSNGAVGSTVPVCQPGTTMANLNCWLTSV